jgi:hypothetical protein
MSSGRFKNKAVSLPAGFLNQPATFLLSIKTNSANKEKSGADRHPALG